MPPFSQVYQLVEDFEPVPGSPQIESLPGQPTIVLNDTPRMRSFLENEMCSNDLEIMAPHLWIMTTSSSANINSLHRQRVKGREIIVTEEPRLHLVWIHNRIFIKPLPKYLLSHTFWDNYLDRAPQKLGDRQNNIRKAATGFLRTYRYLIRHESDFHIAQQDSLRLVPKNIDWPSFCRFTSELAQIEDSTVSGRYCFGELRLTRLNFYAPFLLRKFHFEQVHGQYGDFFARLYGPILFVFALVSTILNSMQVALASEQLVSEPWVSIWYISRYFSIISLLGAGIVATWFAGLWLWLFVDEWVYTARRRIEKRRNNLNKSKC